MSMTTRLSNISYNITQITLGFLLRNRVFFFLHALNWFNHGAPLAQNKDRKGIRYPITGFHEGIK